MLFQNLELTEVAVQNGEESYLTNLKTGKMEEKTFFKFPEQSCKVKFAAKNKIKKLEYYAANKQIDLPKSLRTIKAGTFESCGFDQLVIPKSVKDVERKNGVSGTGILKVLSKKTSRFQSKSKSYRISFLFMVYLSIRILNGRKMLNYVRNKKE